MILKIDFLMLPSEADGPRAKSTKEHVWSEAMEYV